MSMKDTTPERSKTAYDALLKSALDYAAAVDKDESHSISTAEKQLGWAAIRYAGSLASSTVRSLANLMPRPKK